MSQQALHPRTAIINKKQKNQARQAKYLALNWLADIFPQAFDNTVCIRPLKIGIMQDILNHPSTLDNATFSRSKLREAVVLFTRRIDYLSCLKAREMRIDLAGMPVVAVTEAEAEKAALKIKKSIEKTLRSSVEPAQLPSYSSGDGLKFAKNQSDSVQKKINFAPLKKLPLYSTQYSQDRPIKTIKTVITNKITRQFDPDAIARLKERLGLSRQEKLPKDNA